MDFLSPMGKEIIRLIKPEDGEAILDIAAGTGEPGLTIASMVRGGRIIVTDLSDEMLSIAQMNAIQRGIENVEFKACDVCELPFLPNSFDAISCRLGFMFFPDMLLAASEMARVLKPGGRLATSVWNVPEKNFWVTATMGAIQKHMELPAPVPGTPGMFRCAKQGLVGELLEQAGLKNISMREVTGTLNCGTAEIYWEVMTEVAAPVVAALTKASSDQRIKIKNEVIHAVNEKYPEGKVQIESSAWVIYGEK